MSNATKETPGDCPRCGFAYAQHIESQYSDHLLCPCPGLGRGLHIYNPVPEDSPMAEPLICPATKEPCPNNCALPCVPVATTASVDTTVVANDLRAEAWREYDFGGRVYRITDPKNLFARPGGTTHRVEDATGTLHCVPAPGHQGCALRWFPRDASNPVQF